MSSRPDIQAGRAFVSLYIKSDQLTQGLQNAQRRVQEFGSSIMGLGAKIAGAGAGMLAPMAGAVKLASDFEEAFSKFSVVFGDATKDVKMWADKFAKDVGRSRLQIVEFMASSQDLFIPLGFEPGAAEDMSKTITQLAVDLASFNNKTDTDTLRDLHAALTGSSEVMKKYGVIVTETALKQEMLKMGMDPTEATEQQKVMARLAIILRDTSAAHGDATRTAGGFANQMKALKGTLTDIAVDIGSAVLPSLAKFAGLVRSTISPLAEFAKNNQGVVMSLVVGAGMLTAAGVAAIGFGVAIKTAASIATTASTVFSFAAKAASLAWYAAGLAIAALNIKMIIAAKIVQFTWQALAIGLPVAMKAAGAAMAVTSTVVSTAWAAASGIISTAWSGLATFLSTAFTTVAWLAGAAITATAWVTAGVTIAAAFLGLSTTLGALATIASGAWALASGVVATAWTAVSGVVATLAGVASGAWAFAAGVASAAWTGFGAVIAAITSAGSISAALVSAAWTVAGFVMTAFTVKGVIESAVLSAAWASAAAVVGAAWVGVKAIFWAVMTPANIMAATAFVVSAAWSAAAGVVSAAWAAAWSVILSPIGAFLAIGAAAAAVMAAIVAQASYAALAAIDFSKGWMLAVGAMKTVVAVLRIVGETMMAAFKAGQYQTAVKALWVGIQLAFYAGAIEAVRAFEFLFEQAWKATKVFFLKLLGTTMSTMEAVATAITNPAKAGAAIAKGMQDLFNADIKIGINLDQKAFEKLQELQALKKQLAEETAAGTTPESEAQKQLADMEKQLNDALKAAAAGGGVAAPQPGAADTGEDLTDKFKSETDAIEEQIIALEKGAEAARRFRLERDGYSPEQIDKIIQKERDLQSIRDKQSKQEQFDNEKMRLQEQIIEQNKGKDEAMRFRLKNQGFSQEQIEALVKDARELRDLEEKNRTKIKTEKPSRATPGLLAGGTFSARAAIEQGRGGMGGNPVVNELRQARREANIKAREQQELQKEQIRIARGQGLWHG